MSRAEGVDARSRRRRRIENIATRWSSLAASCTSPARNVRQCRSPSRRSEAREPACSAGRSRPRRAGSTVVEARLDADRPQLVEELDRRIALQKLRPVPEVLERLSLLSAPSGVSRGETKSETWKSAPAATECGRATTLNSSVAMLTLPRRRRSTRTRRRGAVRKHHHVGEARIADRSRRTALGTRWSPRSRSRTPRP